MARPRLAEVPFSGTFIVFKRDVDKEFDDEEVTVLCSTSLEICVNYGEKAVKYCKLLYKGKYH